MSRLPARRFANAESKSHQVRTGYNRVHACHQRTGTRYPSRKVCLYSAMGGNPTARRRALQSRDIFGGPQRHAAIGLCPELRAVALRPILSNQHAVCQQRDLARRHIASGERSLHQLQCLLLKGEVRVGMLNQRPCSIGAVLTNQRDLASPCEQSPASTKPYCRDRLARYVPSLPACRRQQSRHGGLFDPVQPVPAARCAMADPLLQSAAH